MAKAPAKGDAKGASPLIPVLVATVLVAGAGAFFGMQIPVGGQSGGAKHEEAKDEGPPKIVVRPLAPITTNVESPPGTWIRLETAAVIKGELKPEDEAMIGKVAEDVVAYLRTLTLEQIESPAGFQHLREDLNDRVRIRSQGKISELLIEALVVQ